MSNYGQNAQSGLQYYSFNRDYFNCPTCGRSIEKSEMMTDALACQTAIDKLPEPFRTAANNQLLPMPSCKVCKSQMQQVARNQLGA